MAKETCHLCFSRRFLFVFAACLFSQNTTTASMTTCLCMCKSLETEGANPCLQKGIATWTCPNNDTYEDGDPEQPETCDGGLEGGVGPKDLGSYIYIHTHICLYLCVNLYIYIYIYIYKHTYVYVYACIYVIVKYLEP